MARRIGFGNQGGGPVNPRRIVMMLAVLVAMDAMAVALILRSVQQNNMTGVIVGIGFSALTSVLMLTAILRLVRGERKPTRGRHDWTDDDEDARG